ncbi:class I SAM-dependent DNA methyltransferase [Streptomyces sp. NPDC017260]|uniref:class I SAM-dependent DNA methyltransferase n=1 Tax=unclassified Streptomyces TaxID=2593676 RepID=UPI0037A38D80
MSTEALAHTDPYANLAESYDRLAEWAITEQQESARGHMADFLQEFWDTGNHSVRRVLEICCGTGLMLSELTRRGYTVTGLDRSPAMLEQARRRLGADTTLIRSELPGIPAEAGEFDAVISAAGGFNYLSESRIDATLAAVARLLPPGGTFVFDVYGPGFFAKIFDPSAPRVMALEMEDTSYIWTFTTAADGAHFDMAYSQFQRAGKGGGDGAEHRAGNSAEDGAGNGAGNGAGESWVRTRDLHRFYRLPHDTVRRLAAAHGFTEAEVHDNYTSAPSGPHTLYDTWTLTRDTA